MLIEIELTKSPEEKKNANETLRSFISYLGWPNERRAIVGRPWYEYWR